MSRSYQQCPRVLLLSFSDSRPDLFQETSADTEKQQDEEKGLESHNHLSSQLY